RRRRRSSGRPTHNPRERIAESEFLEIFSSEDEEAHTTSEYEILPHGTPVSASHFGEFLREEDYSSSSAMVSSSSSSEAEEEDLVPSPPAQPYTSYTPRPPLRSS